MKLAIISDSHDNIPNIEKFLAWAKDNEIETIIHCGDIAAPAMIGKLFAEKFKGQMHLVHGNVSDRETLATVCDRHENITLHGDVGTINVETGHLSRRAKADAPSLQVAFCHFPDQAKVLAERGKYNLVFYGHDHKPWMETLPNGCQLINPGTLGGIFNKATFAVYDIGNKNLELKLLENI